MARDMEILVAEDCLLCESSSYFVDIMSFCDKFIIAWQ